MFSRNYPENPWRTFVLPQIRTRTDWLQILSWTHPTWYLPSDLQFGWSYCQSFPAVESIMVSTALPDHPSSMFGIIWALPTTPEARTQKLQRKFHRIQWRCTCSSTSQPLASRCDFILQKIPESIFRTSLRFLASQVSNVPLALLDLSLKMILVPETEPFCWLNGSRPRFEG